jgi:plasmid stabilization system protein ParE
MSKPVRLDAVAEREAEEAYTWYEGREPGVGERFLGQLARTLEKIEQAPVSCSPVPGRFGVPVRAARVSRFPFRVVFVELADRCRVVAVVHLSQRPGYWAARLEEP